MLLPHAGGWDQTRSNRLPEDRLPPRHVSIRGRRQMPVGRRRNRRQRAHHAATNTGAGQWLMQGHRSAFHRSCSLRLRAFLVSDAIADICQNASIDVLQERKRVRRAAAHERSRPIRHTITRRGRGSKCAEVGLVIGRVGEGISMRRDVYIGDRPRVGGLLDYGCTRDRQFGGRFRNATVAIVLPKTSFAQPIDPLTEQSMLKHKVRSCSSVRGDRIRRWASSPTARE
ncbi:UNVERIFIED_ORG: hypothetical protein GGD51_000589 [Rhizobium esperanzae]